VIIITYCKGTFVALVTQHANCMRHFILLSVARTALPYLSTLSHKRYDFGKKVIKNRMYVLIVSATSV